jgi:hypothetical protein
MITRNEVNYKIDWRGNAEFGAPLEPGKQAPDKIYQDRKHYFAMLRRFLMDVKNLGRDEIDEIFAKYNVHFVDIDDIPRVNIDEPTL